MAETRLDPVRYEIFYNKLDQILNEGKEVIRYLSGSTITREAGEVVQAFYLPTGHAVHIACGILMHILNVTRVIRYMIANRYAEDIGFYEGDQFINNDAYIGGMHAPDTGIVTPFFYKGEVLGWIAAISHTTETGGIDPGGMCPSATEAWHDGIHLPAVKLVERGKMRRDIFNMILRSVRDPKGAELDIRARIAGNERVRQRLTSLADEFGMDFFMSATEQLVKDAEAQARARIKAFKPGIYTSRVYCDTLGADKEKLLIIQLEMEVVEDGTLTLRTPVVSPQSPGYNNAYLPAVEATAFYTMLVEFLYDARWNSGISNGVRIEIPEKSIINADPSMAVGYATVGIGSVFCNALTETLSLAYYISGKEKEVQGGAGPMNGPILVGIDQFGRTCGNIATSACLPVGGGARIDKDGIDSGVTIFNPWSYVSDTEGEEMILPILHILNSHRPDSGGFGKYRGGTSTMAILLIHKTPFISTCTIGCGSKIPSFQGLYGGHPGAVAYIDLMLDTDFYQKIQEGMPVPYSHQEVKQYLNGQYVHESASMASRPMKSGDMLVLTNYGGGPGLGDPIERDPALIVQDIEDKLATLSVAQIAYCVAIDPETLEIDHEKTKKMRQEKREERLKQGIPAKEYVRMMIERRKKRELPQVTLEFLDETMRFSPAFRAQIEAEERLIEKDLIPLKKVKVKRELFKLTPYVKIVEDERGNKVAVCNQCGFGYCDVQENFKLYCLIYDRDPSEIQLGRLAPDKDWCIYREFYCPGCGTQVEVEATPPGTPIIHNVELKVSVQPSAISDQQYLS